MKKIILSVLAVSAAISVSAQAFISEDVFSLDRFQGDGEYNSTAIIDYNNDGYEDVLSIGSGRTDLLCFPNSNGTYGDPVVILSNIKETSGEVWSIDINKDGYLDIILNKAYSGASSPVSSNGLHYLLNNQDGTFASPVEILNSASEFYGLTDVDMDGIHDLITSDGTNLNFHKGVSNLNFEVTSNLIHNGKPLNVELGDTEGDNDNDFLLTYSDLCVLIQNDRLGDFTIDTLVSGEDFSKFSISLNDYNGDDKLDIVYTNYITAWTDFNSNFDVDFLKIRLNNGDNSFQAPVVIYAKGSGVLAAQVALKMDGVFSHDIDNDGAVDIVIQASYRGGLGDKGANQLFINNGNGTFDNKGLSRFAIGLGSQSFDNKIQFLDFNKDNLIDVLRTEGVFVSVVAQDSDTAFYQREQLNLVNKESYRVDTIDFNNDGFLDIFTYSLKDDNASYISLNDGNGSFGNSKNLFLNPQLNYSSYLRPIHWDNNQNWDALIVTDSRVSVIHDYQNSLNNQEIIYSDASASDIGARGHLNTDPKTSDPKKTIYLDFNNDGVKDVFCSKRGDEYLLLLMGTQSVLDTVILNAPSDNTEYQIGDLNNDGYLDLVIGKDNDAQPFLTYLFDDNTNTFASSNSYSASTTQIKHFELFDIDGDGYLDIIYSGFYWLKNNKDGTYQTFQLINDQIGSPSYFNVCDINGDSFFDVIHTGKTYLNKGDNSFDTIDSHSSMFFQHNIICADFNNDGLNDFVSDRVVSGVSVTPVLNKFCSFTYDTVDITSCGEYTWIDNITYSSDTTGVIHTLTNAAGCDSIITLNLTVNAFPVISLEDTSLYVDETINVSLDNQNATFNWENGSSTSNNYDVVGENYGVGWHYVSVEVTDNPSSCSSIDSIRVIVNDTANVTGLFAKYPFNGNANDESGNNFHGTVYGDASLTADRFGNQNSAYSFDGTTDYILIDDATLLSDFDSMAISYWFKAELAQTPFTYMISKKGAFGEGFGNNNTVYNYAYNSGGSFAETYETEARNDGEWHHVVRNFHANKIDLFIDGIFIKSTPFSTGYKQDAVTQVVLGGYTSSQLFFTGDLDDIGFYNKPLVIEEVTDLYNEINPACINVSLNVSLGNDTTIVLGETLTLDAGSFTTYEWLPNSEITQTADVVADTEGIGTHEFSVTVADANGCSASDTINVTIDFNVSSNGVSVANTTIYPNPSEGVLNIKSDVQIGLVEVFELSGRKVISTSNQTTLDITGLESGIYYLNIFGQSGEKLQTINIIKK